MKKSIIGLAILICLVFALKLLFNLNKWPSLFDFNAILVILVVVIIFLFIFCKKK